MRRFALIYLLAFVSGVSAASDSSLLRQVADHWLGEADRWAFTQRVREYDGDKLKEERVERYDPSSGYDARWQLLSIDGRPPTAEELDAWWQRKNRKKRKKRSDVANNFDFEHAKVVSETSQRVVYELPLRSTVEWLFPISKVELLVTINKTGPSLEQVQAQISEPFRVALGIARILDVDLNVQMQPPPSPHPAEAKPNGTAEVVVTKFGDRVEYFWSDFHRVDPPPERG